MGNRFIQQNKRIKKCMATYNKFVKRIEVSSGLWLVKRHDGGMQEDSQSQHNLVDSIETENTNL